MPFDANEQPASQTSPAALAAAVRKHGALRSAEAEYHRLREGRDSALAEMRALIALPAVDGAARALRDKRINELYQIAEAAAEPIAKARRAVSEARQPHAQRVAEALGGVRRDAAERIVILMSQLRVAIADLRECEEAIQTAGGGLAPAIQPEALDLCRPIEEFARNIAGRG